MIFVKRNKRATAKVSLILLDWSVRESFHLLDYLSRQTASRDDFEVIVIEYYARESEAIRKYADQVDTWVLLEMPESCYYHKHLMYNVGIALSQGEIVMIGDSDAMVRPEFMSRIIERFAGKTNIAYHMDQFRNNRRNLYPFNFPSFEEVIGSGCINFSGGKTSGVLDESDPIHTRNYGACMCARRADLIAIGGADEHIDYLGHICGPYEMTFRLVNAGRQEIWETEEFTYHTWHPGAAGGGNYFGPHDGRHMSSTALDALATGRIEPLVENRAIRLLRQGAATNVDEILDKLVDPSNFPRWNSRELGNVAASRGLPDRQVPIGIYKGYRLVLAQGEVHARNLAERAMTEPMSANEPDLRGASINDVKNQIDARKPESQLSRRADICGIACRFLYAVTRRARTLPLPLPSSVKVVLACALAIPLLPIAFILFPRHVVTALRSIMTDGLKEATAIRELAIVIEEMKKNPPDRNAELMVLVRTSYALFLLRILRLLPLTSTVKARIVRTGRGLEDRLRRLESSGWRGTIIIPSELFLSFYATALQSKLARHMVVV